MAATLPVAPTEGTESTSLGGLGPVHNMTWTRQRACPSLLARLLGETRVTESSESERVNGLPNAGGM